MNFDIFNKTTKKLYLLAFGILLLDFSLLYFNKNSQISLNSTILTKFYISLIFGFFHGYKKFCAIKTIEKSPSLLNLLSQFLIYTAWYNVVLLPLSGLGVIEWVFTAFVLFSDFLCAVTGKRNIRLSYIGNSNLNLLIFGCLLMIFKIVLFYIFPDNIYISSFEGNSSARFLILIFCITALIFLISFLFKLIKSKTKTSQISSDQSQKFLKKLANGIKKFFRSLLSLITGPAALIVLLCIGLASLTVIFISVKSITNDILNFVEPYLIKLSSTGKNAVTDSVIYNVCQSFVMASVLIYDIFTKEKLENQSKEIAYKQLNETISQLNLLPEKKQLLLDSAYTQLLKNENFVSLANLNSTEILGIIQKEQNK